MEAREYLKKIKDAGWYLHDTEGAVRQYVNKAEDGFLTVCVRHNDELGPETEASGFRPATADVDGMPEVVLETTEDGVSAYSPDLSGVVATGSDEVSARDRLSEALALHRHALSGASPTL